MTKYTTLADIDKFLYDWLTAVKDKYGYSMYNGFIKANQNSPAPALPYGYWFVKDIISIGHRDQLQVIGTYDEPAGTVNADDLSYYQFRVEITSLGYGSNDIVRTIDQSTNSDSFVYLLNDYGIGYVKTTGNVDLSGVADAEVREARQITLEFNCVMRLREVLPVIKEVQLSTRLDDEAGIMYIPPRS